MAYLIAQLLVPSDGLPAPQYAIIDWPRAKAYLWNTFTPAVRAYSMALATQSPLVGASLGSFSTMLCGDIDPLAGNLIVQAGAGQNAAPVRKYNPASLTQIGSAFGIDATSPSYPTSIWAVDYLVCVVCNGVTYALLKESEFSGHVAVIRVDTMTHAGAYLNVVSGATNNRGIMCRGASGISGGSAFLTWQGSIDGQKASIPLYKVSIQPGAETYNPATWPTPNPFISTATIGTIAAPAIDPAWTTLQANAIGYDATDGNVLLDVTTTNVVTHQHYIAKVNAATVAVMWVVPMGTAAAALDGYNVAHGSAVFLPPGLNDVITSGGVLTTIAMAGLSSLGAVMSDDLSGVSLLRGTYAASSALTPVSGTASSFTGWALLRSDVPPAFPLPPEVKEVLLPSAELQFSDSNGHPYAGGTLELLVPGTTTFKDTWIDPDGIALNTNPIVLDAAGRCIVYGDGAYRSILKDALGNLIWDRETTTEVSAAMMPVVGAPTIAEAQRLLGIDDSGLPAETAAREAADAAETAARIAADANLQSEIDAETAARIAADTALAAIGGPNVRAGTVTTNSSGFAHITFATPFPTACQGITVTPSGQHAPTPLTATTNTPDAAGCDVYTGVYGGTSVAPAATSVYYIAVGN